MFRKQKSKPKIVIRVFGFEYLLHFQNNQLDPSSKHYLDLMDLMVRRDPFYEHPLLEEDNSNATAATVTRPDNSLVMFAR